MTIDDYRKEINRLDSELLRIFNERANLALKIGEIKKEQGIPVYDPEREKRIFVAMTVMNCTLASGGRLAMNATARAMSSTSIIGSATTEPFACGTPSFIRADMSVSALPISIWPHAMLYLRPSREVDLVSPVIACLVAVYGAELGRGACADTEPLLMILPPIGS